MASKNGPQITAIAGILAEQVPQEGVSSEQAKEAWRAALHYAKGNEAMGAIAEVLAEEGLPLKLQSKPLSCRRQHLVADENVFVVEALTQLGVGEAAVERHEVASVHR